MYIQRNIAARSCNHCCSGKAISVTYSEYMFKALCIQHSMRMRRIIFSSTACPTVEYFPTLSCKLHDFRKIKKVTEHKMCFVNIYRMATNTQ